MRATILTEKRSRALRRALTVPEIVLWQALRRRGAGFRFRRQHPMGSYILDFYCPAARVAVELDGAGHGTAEAMRHDRRRDAWLEAQGVQVLRFPATGVMDELGLEAVVSVIVEACEARA